MGEVASKVFDVPLFHDTRLKELNCGVLEGALVRDANRFGLNDLGLDRWNKGLPNGESHKQLWIRIAHSLADWTRLTGDKTVLVCSHLDVMRCVRGVNNNIKGNRKDKPILCKGLYDDFHTNIEPLTDKALAARIDHFEEEIIQCSN
jgi:broad specificity phosphatase PhoE